MKITKKDIKEAKELVKSYKAELTIDLKESHSYTKHDPHLENSEIFIFVGIKGKNRNQFWTRVFHELGHVWCIQTRKHVCFHWGYYTKENVIAAEKYVDDVGEVYCKIEKPDIKYIPLKFNKRTIERAYRIYGV